MRGWERYGDRERATRSREIEVTDKADVPCGACVWGGGRGVWNPPTPYTQAAFLSRIVPRWVLLADLCVVCSLYVLYWKKPVFRFYEL